MTASDPLPVAVAFPPGGSHLAGFLFYLRLYLIHFMISPRFFFSCLCSVTVCAAATLRVPEDHGTIRAAFAAASDGDIVLLAPGTYRESLVLTGKSLTLASHFLNSRDPQDVAATILDVTKPDGKRGASVLVVEKDVTRPARIVGLTFRGASHAVSIHGEAELTHNRFTANGDALSFEGGRGVVRFNTFEGNSDDGIDLDGASAAVIEDNIIRNNRDDGIEARLHAHTGPPLEIVIRRNLIEGNGEDGLQLIDYPGKSARIFRVERNVFVRNAMAAIGCMPDGNTKENYGGAALPERVYLVHNTFVGGEYGVIGGDNMVVLNNVFTGIAKTALKRVHGDSAAGPNLLWQNGTDLEDCDLPEHRFFAADPQLDGDHRPQVGSPCLDAGFATLEFNGETLVVPAEMVRGRAPDLGAFERSGP